MLPDRLYHFTKKLAARIRRHFELISAIGRKPEILRHWLLNAHKAQIFSVAVLILIPLIILPLLNYLLAAIFSPVTNEALFGLIITEDKNPYIDIAQSITLWLVWIFASLYCLDLLLHHIPNTLEHAKRMVQDNIAEADRLLPMNPTESILLYNTARNWSIRPEDNSTLDTKLQYANVVVYNNHQKTEVLPAETLVLTNPVTEPGDTVIAGRYQVKQLIGSGAMGNVYLGEDTLLKREIALKQLSPNLLQDAHIIARFRQEALALARLSHPNIVQVYDFIEDSHFLWIVMELVTGGELEDKLKTSEPLETGYAIRLTLQMADALGYAHKQGVIHRDFKPANVLITDGDDIKITDFGIAKLAQSNILTQLNTVMGTPSHMSPEQANGQDTDQRTDIYALGVVLYQMLSAQLPFKGDSKAIIAQHLTKPAPSLCETNENIPPELDDIVQTMLEKEPDKRFQSMDELTLLLSKLAV